MLAAGRSTPANDSSLNQAINVAPILIVDDNESDRTILSAVLEKAGHEAVVAESGEAAMSLCLESTFEVVITDLQMHEVHGLELITLLRDLSPRPAIIVISGTGSDQLDMARAVGADATLTKPIEPIELLSAVAMAVAGRD